MPATLGIHPSRMDPGRTAPVLAARPASRILDWCHGDNFVRTPAPSILIESTHCDFGQHLPKHLAFCELTRRRFVGLPAGYPQAKAGACTQLVCPRPIILALASRINAAVGTGPCWFRRTPRPIA